MSAAVIAVDVGTSMVKAVRLTLDDRAPVTVSRPAPTDAAPGVDADAVWDTVADVLTELSAAEAAAVEAVVVTGQGDGYWSLEEDGTAGRAYPWNTVVAADAIHAWEADGTIDRHFRRSGTVLWPGTTAAVWRWLQDTDPQRAARTRTVLWAKDWIAYRLCGVVATDPTDATIPFLDLRTGGYDHEALADLGCEALADRLPPIVMPGEEIGRVTAAAAARTGLAEGTPVVMGVIDLVAMIRAAGLREVGDAMAVLGTTAVAVSVGDGVPAHVEPSGATLKLPEPGRILRVLGASSGTTTLEWYLSTHGYTGPGRYDAFWADTLAAADEGVMVLPHLAGERAPFLAPQATGAIVGLTPTTTRAGLGRGVVEGITLSLRHCLEAADAGPGDLVLTGGGATRPEWCQLVADVTGRAVVVDGRPDLGALGAAALVGGFEALATALGAERRTRYVPAADGGSFDHRFATYVALVDAFRSIWKELDRR